MGVDINQCPYSKYLTEIGCPEIARFLCEIDDLWQFARLGVSSGRNDWHRCRQMRFLLKDGKPMKYFEFGQQDETLMVLLHGGLIAKHTEQSFKEVKAVHGASLEHEKR